MEISNEQRAATADRIIAIDDELNHIDRNEARDSRRRQQLEEEMRRLGRLRWLDGG